MRVSYIRPRPQPVCVYSALTIHTIENNKRLCCYGNKSQNSMKGNEKMEERV